MNICWLNEPKPKQNEKLIKVVRQSPKGALEKGFLKVSMGQRWVGCCILKNFLFLERKSTLSCSGPFSPDYFGHVT